MPYSAFAQCRIVLSHSAQCRTAIFPLNQGRRHVEFQRILTGLTAQRGQRLDQRQMRAEGWARCSTDSANNDLVQTCLYQAYTRQRTAKHGTALHRTAHCNTLQNTATHCNILQRTATCYNTLQHTAPHCNKLQHTATHCNTLQHIATRYNTLQHIATHCTALQHATTHCNTLHHTAPHCNTLQHTATHCNTLQHTATHCNTLHLSFAMSTSKKDGQRKCRYRTSSKLENCVLELYFVTMWP